MMLVKWTADGKLRCGGCGRKVEGEYQAQNPAPCGCCNWTWAVYEGQYVLEAVPSRAGDWWPEEVRK